MKVRNFKFLYLSALTFIIGASVYGLLSINRQSLPSKLIFQKVGCFLPEYQVTSLNRWNNKLCLKAGYYYLIDPDSLKCSNLEHDVKTAGDEIATPNQENLFIYNSGETSKIHHLNKTHTDIIELKNAKFGRLYADNKCLVLATAWNFYVWEIKNGFLQNLKILPNKLGFLVCGYLDEDWLYIAHGAPREIVFSKINLKTEETTRLLDSEVTAIWKSKNGQMWTISSRKDWDGGEIRVWQNDRPKLVCSNSGTRNMVANKSDTFVKTESTNWDFPPTHFIQFVDSQNKFPLLLTESEGIFKFDNSRWQRLISPGTGLEVFDRAKALNGNKLFIGGRLNAGTSLMVFDLTSRQYTLLHSDRTEQLKQQHNFLKEQYGIEFH